MLKYHKDKIHIWAPHIKVHTTSPQCLEVLCANLAEYFEYWWPPFCESNKGLVMDPKYIDCLGEHVPQYSHIWVIDLLKLVEETTDSVPATVVLRLALWCAKSGNHVQRWFLRNTLQKEVSG